MENVQVKPKGQGMSAGKILWTSACSILVVFVLLLAVLNLNKYNIFPFSDENSQSQGSPIIGSTSPDDDTQDGPDLTSLISQADTGSGPWLAAAHKNYTFSISGVVPDEQTKTAISNAVDIFYARFNTQNIEVDPRVGSTPWTDAPEDGVNQMLQAMAFRLHTGGFALNKDLLKVEGEAPDIVVDEVAFKDIPRTTATKYPNLPNYEEEIAVVDLTKTPELRAVYDGTSLVMSGALPTRELADGILSDIEILFDGVELVDAIAIEDNMFAAFPVRNFQRNVKAFSFSREFDLTLTGGKFTGALTYGIEFPEGSAELPERVQASLKSFALFTRVANFPFEITGHTDNLGSADANRKLSLERAEAVRQFLIDTGELPPTRAEKITAVGKGSDEPIASNDTQDGRSQNRRVEIVIADGPPL